MSGLIPQSFIDELLQRTDLVELIDSYIPLKKRNNSFISCCPFHTEKTPSFNVVAKKQFYHCFGCGASGNAISFVINYLNQTFPDAIETLAARTGMSVPRDGDKKSIKQSLNLYQLLDNICQFYQHDLKHSGAKAITYLQERRISGDIAKQFQLGYATPDWHTLQHHFTRYKTELITTGMLVKNDDGKVYDRYRDRIMFPIHDRHGRIIGFGGRVIDNTQQPKYLNSPETVIFQKNRELYGLHQVLHHHNSPDSILIVEGYLDVIALAQHGITNAVATLGTATSTFHIQLLSKHTKQLLFCFDGDKAGKQAAWRALENSLPQLDSGLDARFVFLPDNHDPDSFIRLQGQDAFLKQLDNAIPLSDYLLTNLVSNIDTQKAAGITQLIQRVKPYILTMPEGTSKHLLIDELSRITRIENHRISQLINDNTLSTPIKKENNSISRSPIRRTIALIIQHPNIYAHCQHQIDIDLLDGSGQDILQTLLKHIAKHPDTNTAALIELWRDTPLFEPLNKLASWEHQLPDEILAKEFVDLLFFLQKQNLETKINQYIAKSRKDGLAISERLLLQEMLKKRSQLNHDKK